MKNSAIKILKALLAKKNAEKLTKKLNKKTIFTGIFFGTVGTFRQKFRDNGYHPTVAKLVEYKFCWNIYITIFPVYKSLKSKHWIIKLKFCN